MQAQYNKPQRDKRGETQSKKTMYKASHIGNRPKEREGIRTHKRCLSSLQTHSRQSSGLGAPETREDKRQRSAEKKASRDNSSVVETEELQESLRIHVRKSLQPIYVETVYTESCT